MEIPSWIFDLIPESHDTHRLLVSINIYIDANHLMLAYYLAQWYDMAQRALG